MHLSFTIVNGGTSIQLYCDDDGLDALISKLQQARTIGHLHLCSPGCGGNLLNDHDPWGGSALGEVIVTTVSD